jgi:ribosomal protein L29
MSTKDIQKKTTADLEKDLQTKRSDLLNIRFGSAGAKNKDSGFVRKTKIEIARILTELKNR